MNGAYRAARVWLDDMYVDDVAAQGDGNRYTLGRIGQHNVVIATRSRGVYGSITADLTARHLLKIFKDVRLLFTLGIAGGVPGGHENDQLGDVVIGHILLKYDSRRDMHEQPYEDEKARTRPPSYLNSLVAGFRGYLETENIRIDKDVAAQLRLLEPDLEKQFKRPDFIINTVYQYTLSCMNHVMGTVKTEDAS